MLALLRINADACQLSGWRSCRQLKWVSKFCARKIFCIWDSKYKVDWQVASVILFWFFWNSKYIDRYSFDHLIDTQCVLCKARSRISQNIYITISKVAVRKYLAKIGKKNFVIYQTPNSLSKVFVILTVLIITVFVFQKIIDHSWSITRKHSSFAHYLVLIDRCLNKHEVAEIVDNSKVRALNSGHEKLSARWMRPLLTSLLFNRNSHEFLCHSETVYETWMHWLIPETKEQSKLCKRLQ